MHTEPAGVAPYILVHEFRGLNYIGQLKMYGKPCIRYVHACLN